MATLNLGNDFILNDDNDIVIGSNGDWLTTFDYESANPQETQFYNYINIREAYFRRLNTLKGADIFNYDYGLNVSDLVSKNFDEVIEILPERIRAELEKDDRTKSVDLINFSIGNDNTLVVNIFVTVIGQNETSSFIFPLSLIELE